MKQPQTAKISITILASLALIITVVACRVSIPPYPTATSPVSVQAVVTVTAIPANQPAISLPPVVQDEQSLLIELYKRINPAVVNVTVYQSTNGNVVPVGQGSGFLYDQAGSIITNAHVVEGADQFEVYFSDGTIEQAKLLGEDPNSDLAVLRVDNPPADVNALPLANMDEVQVGQTVLAIGNPFGLDGTLTRGIVSAIGRTIPALTPFSIPKAIQTDAPINPGNSGGPLLNLSGEVIGVNAQIETNGSSIANSGVGFAIPVSIVKRVIPELATKGSYDWAWLGVRGTSLTPIYAQANHLPVDKGAYITEIVPGGPASKTDLRGASDTQTFQGRQVPIGGDVITAINGTPIASFDDLLIYIALESSPGESVNLTVLRDGNPVEIPLTLESRPETLPESIQQNP
jgi:S1-C subfamily serine protease